MSSSVAMPAPDCDVHWLWDLQDLGATLDAGAVVHLVPPASAVGVDVDGVTARLFAITAPEYMTLACSACGSAFSDEMPSPALAAFVIAARRETATVEAYCVEHDGPGSDFWGRGARPDPAPVLTRRVLHLPSGASAKWLGRSAAAAAPCSPAAHVPFLLDALRAAGSAMTPPPFYKIRGTCDLTYGDGGYTVMNYPVWVCPRLGVPPAARDALRGALMDLASAARAAGEEHVNEPVIDIVDPNLLPVRLYDPAVAVAAAAAGGGDDGEGDDYDDDPAPEDTPAQVAAHRAGRPLRASYQWAPTRFRILDDEDAGPRAAIDGVVHNLGPRASAPLVYAGLEDAFTRMLPQFTAAGVATAGGTSLDVVVKIQMYALKPGQSYSGRWHVEGLTEGIAASGVYYVHIDAGLEGGALKLKPGIFPDVTYTRYAKPDALGFDAEAPVASGTALVFRNIPHRHRRISNATGTEQVRLFLAFFVAGAPLRYAPAPVPAIALERAVTEVFLHRRLRPSEERSARGAWFVWLVLSFLGADEPAPWWRTWAEAREFRARARAEMIGHPNKWGCIHHGNCGDVTFFRGGHKKLTSRYGVDGTLESTDSGAPRGGLFD